MPRFSDRSLIQMGTKVIAVRIGPEPKHTDFSVHENLIRLSSPCFEAALGRDWKESQERIVKLPDCNAHANLVKAYLLGDYLQDIDFKDAIMDAMIDWANEATRECSNTPAHSSVEIFQHTKSTSPLRWIALDFTTWRLTNNFPMSMTDYQFPSDFLAIVVTTPTQRIRTNKIVRPPFLDKRFCHYHCHGDRTCYKDKDKSMREEMSALKSSDISAMLYPK
ncbi:hypothetical protein FB567DRAFT_625224 [Paraphoma chrysanthemicola]|uniref:BTB domain-containing protein n=1 Tax=Paraphoma chrysanthemicola TaxID=798071 RepID=A0A8K0RBD7_9PLEO|nr:hypothetical protein FB567DRAFT_625224 [Paraphoma chrysanthemicola]